MKQKTRDKRNLLYNGALWSAADAFTAPFIIPLALALGAKEIIIGVITSLQQTGVLLSQVPGSELVWILRKRRALNNLCEFLAKSSWLIIVAIPFLPPESWLTYLMAAVFLSSFFLNLSVPAWTSFVSEVIPKNVRGRYFAKRNLYMGFVATMITILAGFYLDLFPKGNLSGFSSIFMFGFAAGVLAILFFSRIRGSRLRLPEHHIIDYLRIRGNFRKYLTFSAFFGFSYMLASPFFIVYMLQDLRMDYSAFVMFSAISAFAGIVSQRHWGRMIDAFGDRPTMTIAVFGAALVPLFFMFITPYNLIWLIPVQVLSGITWAGVGLANFSMFLDTTDGDKRIVQTADYNIITVIPLIFAPVVGGVIAQNYFFILGGIPLVFLLSGILRLSSILLLRRVKEQHVEKEYPSQYVFRVFMAVDPIRGLAHSIRVVDKAIYRKIRKL